MLAAKLDQSMSTLTSTIGVHVPKRPAVLPLENGDRLTCEEFERRYAVMPQSIKAELIEGVVYMAAALAADFHGEPHADVIGWLVQYRSRTPGIGVADNSNVRLDLDNEPQPDVSAYIQPKFGGRVRKTAQGIIEGAPELVIEVAGSSASIDLNQKFSVYRRNGVQEYVVLRTYDAELDWFVVRDGHFVRATPDAQGVFRSEQFPGLWLDARALLEGRICDVLATLDRGLASPEHANFAEMLVAQQH